MSKIFLIEPDKLLRHAFVMALVPDFEIVCTESLPHMMPSGYDAVIVDGARLSELDLKQADLAQCRVPLLWIEGRTPVELPPVDRCVRISWPVARDSLRRALAQSLSGAPAPGSRAEPQVVASKTQNEVKRKTRKSAIEAAEESGKFIELTEVVEEETA